MNEWYRDPRFRAAEAKQMDADAAERANKPDLAIAYHLEAAETLATLALSVPSDYPHTRSDFAIAAAVSFGCAGRYDRAVQLARRMLAEQGALSMRGRGELSKIVEEYSPLIMPMIPMNRLPAKRATRSDHRMRDAVRVASNGKPEAA